IHMLVKEPGKSLYYIDEVWFDDDPLISKKLNDESENRGGNLIIPLSKNKDDFWSGNLSITLGLNIPDYK
ncbi:MAG: intradiol ring-cleavage dioxygenase, partial [Chitinophagales bacterium]|nr:intradiol ring-cleavage dioxygenase [Chitinophagales bacterium]